MQLIKDFPYVYIKIRHIKGTNKYDKNHYNIVK